MVMFIINDENKKKNKNKNKIFITSLFNAIKKGGILSSSFVGVVEVFMNYDFFSAFFIHRFYLLQFVT